MYHEVLINKIFNMQQQNRMLATMTFGTLSNSELRNYNFMSWQPGYDYKKDWIIEYDGNLYRIGQDHTSQTQWLPGSQGTEALYSKIEIVEEGYEVWQEWDGVSGIYAKDQIVKDPTDGQLYQSLINNNVWGPPSTQPNYWQLYTES